MKINVYEILSTNSLSGSRIIINDNFKMIADGLNVLYNNISLDNEGKMSINEIENFSAKNINVEEIKADKFSNNARTCMIFNEDGHLLILDANGNLALDVNDYIINHQ